MKKLISLVTCLFFLVAGCASFVSNTYKGEYVAGAAYNVGMQTIADLQKAGTVTAEVRSKVNEKADLFYKSYMVAVDALGTYYTLKDDAAQQKVYKAIAAMFQYWGDLAALINSISPGTVPTNVVQLRGATPKGEVATVTIRKIDPGTISIIIQIGTAVVQYLLPIMQDVVNAMQQNVVTLDEIVALKLMIKPPAQY